MYHLILKFLTLAGVGVIRENQVEARRYYTLALKEWASTHQETNTIGSSNLVSFLLVRELKSSLVGNFAPMSLPRYSEISIQIADDLIEQPKQLNSAPHRHQQGQAELLAQQE